MGRPRKYKNDAERVKAFRQTNKGKAINLLYDLTAKAKAKKRWFNQDAKKFNVEKRTTEFAEVYGEPNSVVFENNSLTQPEKDLLSLYFGLQDNKPHHIDECANLLNMSLESAKKIKATALRKL